MGTINQLKSASGQALLASLPPYDEANAFALTTRLREQGYTADLVAAALTQSRLRLKAHEKFADFADGMMFTAAGLEQATRLQIGGHHAARLRRAGARHVVDLGCGIGADSLTFAGLGLGVTAIERDHETAEAAAFNLRAFPEARVIEADAFALDLSELGADALWLDPARRANGKRLTDPEEWQPRFSEAIALARKFPAAGIKVAPGVAYEYLPDDAHVQWISADRELIEAVVWLGVAAPKPGRSALMLRDSKTLTFEAASGSPAEPVVPVAARELGPYMYEPDPAVIRAGGIERLAGELDLAPVSEGIAYLTGEPVESDLLGAFRVREVLPMNAKAVKKALQREGIGQLEIKKRGTDVTPEEFRRKLSLKKAKGARAVLILTPLLGRHRAVLATRER